jgi:hypothetical protein
LDGSLKIKNVEKIKNKNALIKFSFFMPNFTYSGAKISKIVFRNPPQTPVKMARYGLTAKNIQMRITGIF